ncbi:MAG: aminotransferase class V-fold PLP-dependent enzyme [Gammaproteobacteria bacterium]|nr:aminotransferase class V-fold PLP-dependent enzyme [Gammaproteobacteria bacterium]
MSGHLSLPIFLDHASTTPLDPAVGAVMVEVLQGPLGIGNPSSSTHEHGRAAAAVIEQARVEIARLINADTQDLVFTSGATEADNLAVLGLARGRVHQGRHVVTARTEHKAVLDPCKQLEKRGWQVSWLEPARDGRITAESLAAALRDDTQLVSIMHANNETGVVQDIAALAAVCRERAVFLHCDAAQSAARLPLDVHALGIDLLSLSAHKMYGPKGVGALWVSPRARPWLEPLMWGGGHERGLRPGTLATHQIAGFGEAADRVRERRDRDAAHVEQLVAVFRKALQGLKDIVWNDHPQFRLPGLVSISVLGVEGESLIAAMPGIAVSSGAACDSAVGEPSYVLRAQGVAPELAQSTLRISFGRFNSEAEAQQAAAILHSAVAELRDRDAPGPPAGEGWHMGMAGSLREGARIRAYLRTRPAPAGESAAEPAAASSIEALEFRAATCPAVRAVLDELQRRCVGRPLADPALGGPRDWAREFALPIEKLGRLLLVEDALRAAVAAALK